MKVVTRLTEKHRHPYSHTTDVYYFIYNFFILHKIIVGTLTCSSTVCLSPSGCTFWGKKPWSQTRKVLWQVGMLLGAPVVISLIAGIAIPVIIVGIPIYMARKVQVTKHYVIGNN